MKNLFLILTIANAPARYILMEMEGQQFACVSKFELN